MRVLPYRLGDDLVLDVAQVIPLPDAEHYVVRIRDREAAHESRTYPDRVWTREELDACAHTPEKWVSLADIRARGSIEEQARWPTQRFGAGALDGLTRRIRREFGRDSWPMDFDVAHGGDSRAYRLPDEIATWWRATRDASRSMPSDD